MFIVIGRRQMTIVTTDGLQMRVRPLYVRKEGVYKRLHECNQFDDLSTIKIVLKGRWGKISRIPRNALLEKALRIYLQSYHTRAPMSFDCYAFVNLVQDVTTHKVAYMHAFWDIEQLRRKPEVGDILFLGDFKEHFFMHAVVYIGLGLCISVYGGGGDIEVSTIADMKRELNAKDVFIARQKNKAVISQ